MPQAINSDDLMRPLSVGNIVNIGFSIYRARLKLYFSLALRANLWIVLPLFGAFSIWAIIFKSGSRQLSNSWVSLLIGISLIFLIYGLTKFLANSALISRLAFNEITGRTESIKEARIKVISKAWSFLNAGILIAVICFCFTIVLMIILSILSFLLLAFAGAVQAFLVKINQVGNRNLLLLVGIISLLMMIAIIISFVFGLIWIYSRFLVAEVPLAVEGNINSSKAVSRSWELTKKSVTRIQGAIAITFLITLPVQLPIQIISIIIQSQKYVVYELLYTIIAVGLGLLGGALVMPFWQAVKAVIYYDLRIRQEGLGMQQRIHKLSANKR